MFEVVVVVDSVEGDGEGLRRDAVEGGDEADRVIGIGWTCPWGTTDGLGILPPCPSTRTTAGGGTWTVDVSSSSFSSDGTLTRGPTPGRRMGLGCR